MQPFKISLCLSSLLSLYFYTCFLYKTCCLSWCLGWLAMFSCRPINLFGKLELKVWVLIWQCSQSYKLLWGLTSPVLAPFTSLATFVGSHPSPNGISARRGVHYILVTSGQLCQLPGSDSSLFLCLNKSILARKNKNPLSCTTFKDAVFVHL